MNKLRGPFSDLLVKINASSLNAMQILILFDSLFHTANNGAIIQTQGATVLVGLSLFESLCMLLQISASLAFVELHNDFLLVSML